MTDIVERLHGQITSDHIRGCTGRQYSCSCGYDAETERLLSEAAAEIKRLQAEAERLQRGEKVYLEGANRDATEIERLRTSIRTIGRRSAPSTRTWDGMIADMGWINDETRAALEPKP
jgi:hypothetical protein